MNTTTQQVADLANKHNTTWRDKPESYWLARLTGEVGELACSLVGDHEGPIDWELKQIAAICLNWLDMRADTSAAVLENSAQRWHER